MQVELVLAAAATARRPSTTVPGIAGPILPAVSACEWCSATVTYDPERDVWVDANGGAMCTPEARGATGAWASYRAEGIEPTTLRNHDLACTCQFAFPHMGGKTAAYTSAVPVCCGRPMRAMTAEWRCREHCGRVVLPGEPCEVYLAAAATAPGPVTRTSHGRIRIAASPAEAVRGPLPAPVARGDAGAGAGQRTRAGVDTRRQRRRRDDRGAPGDRRPADSVPF